jgi:DNA-binding transcriptional LysR family regulator
MSSRIEPAHLAAVRTLMCVIEAASLTEAGRRLDLTPSGVSRQISRLEEALGASLLVRTTRRVRPTPAGMELYQRARPLFEAFAQATADVGERDREVAGRVRISASLAFGRARLLPLLSRLATLHPGLRFDVVLTGRRLDFVEDEIDLAVREGRLADSSLTARKLGDARVVLCAAPPYLARSGHPKRLSDLARHEMLMVPNASVPPALRRQLPAEPRFRVNDLFSLRQLAEAGAGIAPLPDYVAAEPVKRGALSYVLPRLTIARIPMHVVYPSRRLLSRRVQVVIEALVRKS